MEIAKKQYKDVFIDFDDTIYDTRHNSQVALEETFAYFHLEQYFSDPQVFYSAYWQANEMLWRRYSLGLVTKNHLREQRFRIPLNRGLVEGWLPFSPSTAFCLKVNDWFVMRASSQTGLLPGARQLIDYLRERGYGLHMCSNGFHEVQYRKLAACHLNGAFHNIILSEDAGVNKPDKRYFDYAFRITHAAPATTIMIGDNQLTDIYGAQTYEFDTIFFNPQQHPLSPDVHPTHEVSSLTEISTIL